MLNSTHTLVGLTVARTGLDRWNRHAAWTSVIAANLPDIDIAAMFYDTPAYIEYHRGVTHALIGIPILSLALAAVMCKFSGNFGRTLVVALIAMSTHPLLDYMNTYGVRPFLPFDGSWFYGDTLFIIDPLFDLALASALATGHLIEKYRRHFAIGGLVAVTLYIGARTELRNLSRSYLSDFDKAAVSPAALNPFRWTGLIDSAEHVSVVAIDAFKGLAGKPDQIPKVPPDSVIRKAAETRSGNAFFGFARFPVTRVRESESGYSVLFLDVRYYNDSSRTGFAAKIRLDSSLRIIDESLGFNQSVD